MSKKSDTKNIVDATIEEPKTDDTKMSEEIEAMKAQIQHHNTMLIKAQGALEVLTALTEEVK